MMKKIIALALALSMALSMVAFAGYTDAALVNEDLTADVELVGALGLMQGNTDGSFNPTGYLKRGEAAVIIYRLHSGKSTIDASWGDASLSNFSDMDHWSAPYVNYCAALGLIAGYTDGTFRPENNVSTVEMAKMLLNVAGYDTEKQGYGKNWPGAVLADASSAGLFDSYDAAFTGLATREWVAKLVSNMIKNVNTVGYIYGDILSEGAAFGKKYGVEISDVMIAKANTENGISDNKKTTEKNTSKVGTNTFIKYDIPTELLGHDVKVYYKDSDSVEGLSDGDKVYTVVDASKKVVTSTMDKVTMKSTDGKVVLTVDGVKVDEDVKALYAFESLTSKGNPFGTSALNDNRAVELIYNESSKAWYAKYNKVVYTTVKEFKAENYTFVTDDATVNVKPVDTSKVTDAEKKDYASVKLNDTVKAKDYVAVEVVGKDTVVYNVSKLNAKTTKIANVSGSTFTVGSDTYKAAALKVGEFNIDTFLAEVTGNKDTSVTYDIYTDGKYVVFAQATPEDTTTGTSALVDNIAYLIDMKEGSSATSAFENDTLGKVQILLPSGDFAIYEYDAPSKECVDFKANDEKEIVAMEKGTIYEYVLNEDGTLYFTGVATSKNAKKAAISTGTVAISNSKSDASKNYITLTEGEGESQKTVQAFFGENSFFFYALIKGDTAKYGVVKASELVAKKATGESTTNYDNYTFGNFTAYAIDSTTGLNTLAYGVLNSTKTDKLPTAVESATGSAYFFLLSTASEVKTQNAKGEWVSTWSATGINADGEKETLSLTSEPGKAGSLYIIKTTSTTKTLAAAGEGEFWKKGKIAASTGSAVLIGNTLHDIADDATIIYVKKGTSGFSQVAGPDTVPFSASYDVMYKLDKNNVVTDLFIVVDAENKIADSSDLAGFLAPQA